MPHLPIEAIIFPRAGSGRDSEAGAPVVTPDGHKWNRRREASDRSEGGVARCVCGSGKSDLAGGREAVDGPAVGGELAHAFETLLQWEEAGRTIGWNSWAAKIKWLVDGQSRPGRRLAIDLQKSGTTVNPRRAGAPKLPWSAAGGV